MKDNITTVEIDLDDDTVEILERLFEKMYLKDFSEASLSVWENKEVDLAKRLGETLLNELIYTAVRKQIEDES